MCTESFSHSLSPPLKTSPLIPTSRKSGRTEPFNPTRRSVEGRVEVFNSILNCSILISRAWNSSFWVIFESLFFFPSMAIGSMATAVDPHHCLRVVDAIPISSLRLLSLRASCSSGNDGGLGTRVAATIRGRSSSLELSSSFVGESLNGCGFGRRRQERRRRKRGNLVVVSEIAGQYDDNFRDIDAQMVNYFTYKAVRTVLHQLYEMNPPSYMWFYNYVATNDMNNSKRFLRKLVKEKQDLAERVMITRLHLYGKWIKKCDHAKMYQLISDENTNLMRERLMETVIWPSDDSNPEKIG